MAQALVLKGVQSSANIAPTAQETASDVLAISAKRDQRRKEEHEHSEHHHHHGGSGKKHKEKQHSRHHHEEEKGDDRSSDEEHHSRRERRFGGHGQHHHETEEEERHGRRNKHIGMAIEGTVPSTDSIRSHLDDYLSDKIEKYMQNKRMCRADAVRAALEKARHKQYPVIDADSGYGYGFVATALDSKGSFELKLHDIVLNSVASRRINDCELRVSFAVPGASVVMPCRGQYELVGRFGEPLVVVHTAGFYDLASRGVVPGSGVHIVPTALYREKKISRIAGYDLPSSELHAVVEAIDLERVRVQEIEIVVNLRPNAPAILDPRSTIPCPAGRTALTPSRFAFGFASDEERRASECTSRPAALNELVARIMNSRIGTDPSLTYRLVSHVGRQQVCQLGRTPESHKDFYRLGHCTETLSVIALCAHIQEHAPAEFGQRVDMHSSKLTKFLLKSSGASNVYQGLKKAFGCFGRGTVPSPYDLMNHCSGLPAHFDASCEILHDVLASAQGPAAAGFDIALFERNFGEKLSKHCKPLHAPGGDFHYSSLNFAIIRFMLSDWKTSPHSCEYLTKCAGDLGMPTMCFAGRGASHAPSCPSTSGSCVPTMHGEPESPLHLLSTGGSCRVDEFAAFLAASGPTSKHSWSRSKASEGVARFAFLPDILVPRTCIDRAAMHYHGYGLDHIGLPCAGFGKHGLRALLRVGVTPTHHTFIACIVPALSLSFCFGTNADISSLCDKQTCSIVPFLTELVSAHVSQIATLENSSLKRATIFNPIVNAQLCVAPEPGPTVAHHIRYCAGKSPFVAERDNRLDAFVGESFLSLTDMRYSVAAIKSTGGVPSTNPEHYAPPVTLSLSYEEVVVDDKSQAKQGVYRVTERYAHGDAHVYTVVYDPDAYRSTEAARLAFESHEKGLGLDKRECGMHRVLQPSHGLLGEYLELATVQINATDAAASKEKVINAKVVCFRGRIYLRGGLYELVRRRIVPTLDDRVNISLASKKPPAFLAASSDSELAEPSIGTASGASLSEMLRATLIGSQLNPLPGAKHIGPHGGGGFGGGGGGFHGGYGYRPGYGYGYGLGAGLATGAVLGAGLYGPAYYPAFPGYYGYGGYGGYGMYGGFCRPGCRRAWGCVC